MISCKRGYEFFLCVDFDTCLVVIDHLGFTGRLNKHFEHWDEIETSYKLQNDTEEPYTVLRSVNELEGLLL